MIKDLEKDNVSGAIGKLVAFVNETERMIRSRQLTEEQGHPLVVKANGIIGAR